MDLGVERIDGVSGTRAKGGIHLAHAKYCLSSQNRVGVLRKCNVEMPFSASICDILMTKYTRAHARAW